MCENRSAKKSEVKDMYESESCGNGMEEACICVAAVDGDLILRYPCRERAGLSSRGWKCQDCQPQETLVADM